MDKSEKNLNELFNQGVEAMRKAEAMARSDARQELYIFARKQLEKSMDLAESLDLFSDNETAGDIATADLKYILIPAYLAKITISSECGPNRLQTFTRADFLIRSFLHRILKYGLGDDNVERAMTYEASEMTATTLNTQPPSLEMAMRKRNEKIESFKRMQVLEKRLSELDHRINSGLETDDEVVREYYISLIKKWIYDSLESLEREVKPALFFEGSKQVPVPTSSKPEPIASKPKTFTIVKDDVQKQVFGLGYPSKPTVTVDEFISNKIKTGDLAFQAHKEVYANSLQRYAEQPNLRRDQEELSDAEHDEKEEREDADELERKRKWDEFKDDNPRGSGNRYNMG